MRGEGGGGLRMSHPPRACLGMRGEGSGVRWSTLRGIIA
jgi:hypothetical protein